ncbi:DEAD/DEAH box helicase, partial [Streptomyces albiflaviniger]|nr:DEAD/DEAH box helicase [Streptomyces albiflaviniger]
MPDEGLVDVAGAQQIDARKLGVPPVPRALPVRHGTIVRPARAPSDLRLRPLSEVRCTMEGMAGSALDGFSPATRGWFTGAFTAPTPAQEGAWRAIGAGSDVLVVAPTGSGKTLAAFLAALD